MYGNTVYVIGGYVMWDYKPDPVDEFDEEEEFTMYDVVFEFLMWCGCVSVIMILVWQLWEGM